MKNLRVPRNLQNLRILQFGRFNPARLPGGVQAHADQLSKALGDDCHVDNLVAHLLPKTEIHRFNGYTLYEASSLGRVASTSISPGLFSWAKKLHEKNSYDLIHLHFPDPLAMLCAATVFRHTTVKKVITWHSDVVSQTWALPTYLPLLKRFLKNVDAIMVPTPHHLKGCKQISFFPKQDRVFIIPFGIETGVLHSEAELFSNASRIRDNYQNKPIVFFLGRHVAYKGIDRLLRSFTQVKGDAAQLVIGGEGPLTSSLKNLASELGLINRVHFVGALTENEKQAYLRACDIFCLPSINTAEAFGIIQAEAMLHGKPSVCFELNNGVTYLNEHGKTGLVVPLGDINALAQALDKLILDRELREKLGANARARVQNEFSVAQMKEKTLQLYDSILRS